MQNRQFKTLYKKQLSIAILLTGIAVLFFSCANKIEKIKEFSAAEKLPGMEADNFEMLYSDSAVVRFKLIAPKLHAALAEEGPALADGVEGLPQARCVDDRNNFV